VFTLPFEGRWHVVWGGTSLARHYHGRLWPEHRYAYDFVAVDGAVGIRQGFVEESNLPAKPCDVQRRSRRIIRRQP
jgi:hypothetical protein